MSRFLALVKTLFRAMSQLHKDLPPWLKYAALVVLVAAGAGFLIWKWGFRKQIDAAKIARLPVVGIDSLRFLPDGKLASMRSTPSGFVTVFIWDAQNQLLLHESNEFDVTEFVTFLDSYLEYSRLSITEIRRNKTPYYAVTRDGERLVMFYRGLLAAFRPNLQFTVYDDPISDRVRESGVYLKSYDKWQELLYEGVQIVDLGSAKEAPAALTAHIVRHGCQERAFTQSITAPKTRGALSIKVYNLNDERIVTARREAQKQAFSRYNRATEYFLDHDYVLPEAKARAKNDLAGYLTGKEPYSAAVIEYLRREDPTFK